MNGARRFSRAHCHWVLDRGQALILQCQEFALCLMCCLSYQQDISRAEQVGGFVQNKQIADPKALYAAPTSSNTKAEACQEASQAVENSLQEAVHAAHKSCFRIPDPHVSLGLALCCYGVFLNLTLPSCLPAVLSLLLLCWLSADTSCLHWLETSVACTA